MTYLWSPTCLRCRMWLAGHLHLGVGVDSRWWSRYLMPTARGGMHMLMHNIIGDCNWAEGCHCTIDSAPPGCDKSANKEGPPTWVGALAFAPLNTASGTASAAGDGRWAGLLDLQLVKPGAYNLSAPALSSSWTSPLHYWFAHREEPKLLWSWSANRYGYPPLLDQS